MTRSGPASGTPALPSLLRNLTSTSTRSAPSVSVDTPLAASSSSLDADAAPLTARRRTHSSKSSIHSRHKKRTSTDRLAPDSNADSVTPTSRLVHAPSPSLARPTISRESTSASNSTDDPRETSRSRSRASSSASGSSLEGLTLRLHGARRGRTVRDTRSDAEPSGHSVEDAAIDRPLDSTGTAERGEGTDDEAFPPGRSARARVPTVVVSSSDGNGADDTSKDDDGAAVGEAIASRDPAAVGRTADESRADSPFDEANASRARGDERVTPSDGTLPLRLRARSDDMNSDDSRHDSEPPADAATSSDSDDDEDSVSLNFVARSDSQPDPRDMLRAQLLRAGPDPTRAELEPATTPSSRDAEATVRRSLGSRTNSAMSTAKANLVPHDQAVKPRRLEPRRYFILSTAGKLVYTSDQNEEMATGLVGAMQAIVSIFADEGDKIRCVEVGDSKITFLLKSPLYLVVSSSWGEPESVLRTHLDYLYLQVLSVVTLTQLHNIFSRRSNFDLRRMMEGTEPFFHSLVSSLQTSIPILTSSIEVYRLDPGVRAEVAKALDPGRDVTRKLDLLYVLLLAHGRLVTLLRPKKHSIHPTDLHLLLSTIYSTSPPRSKQPNNQADDEVKEGELSHLDGPVEERDEPRRVSPLTEPGLESWLPICLPRFNPKGFLHAYVSFFPSHSTRQPLPTSSEPSLPPGPVSAGSGGGIGLVLLSTDRDAFLGVKDAAEGIKEALTGSAGDGSIGRSGGATKGGRAAGGLVHEIEKARSVQEYSLGELAIPGLRHFVYKSRSLVQTTRPAWEGDYVPLAARHRLVTLYQHLSDTLHPRPAQSGSQARKPAQVQYLRTEHEAVLGWSTPTFELYVTTSPVLPHSAAVAAARSVSKWVEKHEQRLFLTSSPSF
ncbi:hypothetical protein JCM10212_005528 [Sporobolomyces blumeae]